MEKKHSLKPIKGRRLKSGDWIVVAKESDALIVNEELAKSLIHNNSLDCYDIETVHLLQENGFYIDENDKIESFPDEKNNIRWNIKRMTLFILGGLSILISLVLSLFKGIPSGSVLINSRIPLPANLIYLIAFSLITTLIHELMHIIFSRSYFLRTGGLRLNFVQAKATVSMTHIWVWSFLSRLAALSAGLAFDSFLLATLLILDYFVIDWKVSAAISILWLRIIWQFRFHKNCDGYFIASALFDNPILGIDSTESSKEIKISRVLKIIGYAVNLLIIVYWVIPFLWILFSSIFL